MFKRKARYGEISSPVSGSIINLDETGDEVFAGRMVGDGVAIIPETGEFVSPCDGVVENVAKTSHAYSISSKDGLDILVHIGIDTVELGGEGFSPKVKSGDRVTKGQAICSADLGLISSKGYSIATPILISNVSDVEKFTPRMGKVERGDVIIDYTL